MPHRIDQLLSNLGYCSRKDARACAKRGEITYQNGDPVPSVDLRVSPANLRFRGEALDHPEGLFILFHKPVGYTCSHDPQEGKVIYELFPERWLRRKPQFTSVGRLDKDTSGIMICTDSGALVQKLTSPKSQCEKVYQVWVDKKIDPQLVPLFASGNLILRSEKLACAPAQLDIKDERMAELTLTEGKYHQVRRMFAAMGYHVKKLHRRSFAGLGLDDLPVGAYRDLDCSELKIISY